MRHQEWILLLGRVSLRSAVPQNTISIGRPTTTAQAGNSNYEKFFAGGFCIKRWAAKGTAREKTHAHSTLRDIGRRDVNRKSHGTRGYIYDPKRMHRRKRYLACTAPHRTADDWLMAEADKQRWRVTKLVYCHLTPLNLARRPPTAFRV